MKKRGDRRSFLKSSAAVGMGYWVIPGVSVTRADSPNEKINFACIGVGGKGDSDTNDAGHFGNIVALCDIDDNRLNKMGEKYPNAKKFNDYRKMLEEMGNQIDAVTVSTPDHTHAPASVMAMRMGKHCFCQKPLTWSVEEARVMRELAVEKKLATQMGNQGTAHDGFREGIEVIQSGALGPIQEIHVWTNRPVWPQGIKRPTATPGIPNHVHWYEFLGPAHDRPYHPSYAPFNWRGWLDFGTGALGDMACHTLNIAFHALQLVDPQTIEVVDTSGIVDNETFPKWSIIRTEFGPRGELPPLTMTWYDGGHGLPPEKRVPDALLQGEPRPGSGLLLVGKEGSFFSKNDYGSEYVLLAKEKFQDLKKPEPRLPRVGGNHFKEFVDSIKGGPPAMSNFEAAGRLTETVLLGVVALRAGTKIEWDPVNMKAKGCPQADQYIRRDYRKGWEI